MPFVIAIIFAIIFFLFPEYEVFDMLNLRMYAIQNALIYILFSVLFLYRKRKLNIVCIELFLFLSLFWVTFVYPIFIYDTQINVYLFDRIADIYIIKGIHYTMLGFLFYLLGASIPSKRKVNKNFDVTNYKLNKIMKLSNYIGSILIIYLILSGGLAQLNKYITNESAGSEIIFYISIMLIISSIIAYAILKQKGVTSFKQSIISINKHYVINMVFMISFYLLGGNRSAALPLILSVLFLHSFFIKKINIKQFAMLFIIGVMTMVFIRENRSNTDGEKLDFIDLNANLVANVFEVSKDFIGITADMAYLIEYTENNGSQQGQNAIPQILSIIPFLQSLLLPVIFDAGTIPKSSSYIATTGIAGMNWTSGLGTHIIGDLYYTFGLLGVILSMFFYGILNSYLYNRIMCNDFRGLSVMLAYLIVLGYSVFIVRVEFFYIMRIFGFSLILFYLIKLISPLKIYSGRKYTNIIK